jgi:hypothetical protein
MLRKTARTLM